MFTIITSVSRCKFRSKINFVMMSKKMFDVIVSSTICQECETSFTDEPQTANDACNESQTNV